MEFGYQSSGSRVLRLVLSCVLSGFPIIFPHNKLIIPPFDQIRSVCITVLDLERHLYQSDVVRMSVLERCPYQRDVGIRCFSIGEVSVLDSYLYQASCPYWRGVGIRETSKRGVCVIQKYLFQTRRLYLRDDYIKGTNSTWHHSWQSLSIKNEIN